MKYRGSCHCGDFQIEVTGDLVSVMECNCSICHATGFLHWIVNEEQVVVLSDPAVTTTYVWGTGVARHYFCKRCGVALLRRPMVKPDGFSVNVRCLDNTDLSSLEVEYFDGKTLI
jgi:hypothetical protein